jgi:hypothetical protein
LIGLKGSDAAVAPGPTAAHNGQLKSCAKIWIRPGICYALHFGRYEAKNVLAQQIYVPHQNVQVKQNLEGCIAQLLTQTRRTASIFAFSGERMLIF